MWDERPSALGGAVGVGQLGGLREEDAVGYVICSLWGKTSEDGDLRKWAIVHLEGGVDWDKGGFS